MSGTLDEAGPAQPTQNPLSLALRVYPFRTLGMGLGVLPVLIVLKELDAQWPAWAWTLFCGYVWPHLAYFLHARLSRDPFAAERRNLTIDSAMAGSLVPLMHFTLLPSVVLLTVVMADKVNTGVRGLWRSSLLALVGALLATGLSTGFEIRLATSLSVLLACLPIMVLHTLAVSFSTYRLIRRVQKQNLRLDELSRFDTLTGLESRGHWQEHAAAMLKRHRSRAMPACLLLIDIDRFKAINDRHGHAVGDDVLRSIADVLRHALPAGSHAGRLGGDEFAIALPVDPHDAYRIATRIRIDVTTLAFSAHPELRCTVSIGLARPPDHDGDLRAWSELADRALYQAKAQGRNATVALPEETGTDARA